MNIFITVSLNLKENFLYCITENYELFRKNYQTLYEVVLKRTLSEQRGIKKKYLKFGQIMGQAKNFSAPSSSTITFQG